MSPLYLVNVSSVRASSLEEKEPVPHSTLENWFLILFLAFESLLDLLPEGFDLSDMSYILFFHNKAASEITVSHLLMTNQKRGNFLT